MMELVKRTYFNEKDGSILEFIPGCNFAFGRLKLPYMPPFYLAIYPVTNKQYFKFVLETGYHPPEYGLFDNKVWKKGKYPKGLENHPVVNVTWFDAKEYCIWADLRLPSELEWERGACGFDKRVYPWGTDWSDGKFCRNYLNRGKQTTAAVDDYSEGVSLYGIHQMSGNVLEWCDDFSKEIPGPTRRPTMVLKGGSWLRVNPVYFQISHTAGAGPYESYVNVGFRCAK